MIAYASVAYNLDQAVEASGFSVRTLRDAIRAGDLTAHYSGTKPVILAADLHEWIESLPTARPGGDT